MRGFRVNRHGVQSWAQFASGSSTSPGIVIAEQIGLVSSFGQSAPFIAGTHEIIGIESLPHACASGLPSGPVTFPARPVMSMMLAAGSLQVHPVGHAPALVRAPLPAAAPLVAAAPVPALAAAWEAPAPAAAVIVLG